MSTPPPPIEPLPPTCPYCTAPAECVTGAQVYPHRPDLAGKTFWRCAPCDARVGCHPGTRTPLGGLANAVTRDARSRAHAAFDALWNGETAVMGRRRAYAMLALELGLEPVKTHIGHFDEATCERVIEASARIRERVPQ